jgi:hypothetical protein
LVPSVSNFLLCGLDFFPVKKERDGVEYELFHCRAHVLGVTAVPADDGDDYRLVTHHSSLLTGPPRHKEDAIAELEAELNNHFVPGSEISPRLLGGKALEMKRIWPHRDALPTAGEVVGHVVMYTPYERGSEHPQLVEYLSVLIPQPNGKKKTVPVRLRPPGAKPFDAIGQVHNETYYAWNALRQFYPMGTTVKVLPRRGFYLLGEPLPEEQPATPAEIGELIQLQEHFGPRV